MVKKDFLFNEIRLLKIGLVNSYNKKNDNEKYMYLHCVVDSFIKSILANDKLSRGKNERLF